MGRWLPVGGNPGIAGKRGEHFPASLLRAAAYSCRLRDAPVPGDEAGEPQTGQPRCLILANPSKRWGLAPAVVPFC